MKHFRKIVLALAVLSATCRLVAQPSAKFPAVAVPPVVAVDSYAAAEYYAEHYWDKYDFAHYAEKYTAEVTEQGFVDFTHALSLIPFDSAATAVRTMISRAEVDAVCYERFMELAEKYFYDPNSPLRNDEFFIPVLEYAIASKATDPTMKVRYRELLGSVSKNRPATTATDFVYTLADGRQKRMKSIESDFLLLYFYNAGCPNCREVKDFLEHSDVVKFYRENGYLKVLAVYPDADLKEWRRWLPENPSWWISSYDKGEKIRGGELYDLKAIPTMYLLDRNKQVILKDPTPETLEGVLRSM